MVRDKQNLQSFASVLLEIINNPPLLLLQMATCQVLTVGEPPGQTTEHKDEEDLFLV